MYKDQSKSTFNNYLHRIALISLHFGGLHEDISNEESTISTQGLLLTLKRHPAAFLNICFTAYVIIFAPLAQIKEQLVKIKK